MYDDIYIPVISVYSGKGFFYIQGENIFPPCIIRKLSNRISVNEVDNKAIVEFARIRLREMSSI